MHLIIGLGNPDSKYLLTRHNMGYWAVDELCERCGIALKERYPLAVFGRGEIGGKAVIVAKPTTYMNNSGACVADMAWRYQVDVENIIIIYDDVDMPAGRLRLRLKGGPGTHNGMRSIFDHLEDENFPRVRVGIGAPPQGMDIVPYVLGKPHGDERLALMEAVKRAAQAVEEALTNGMEAAMQSYNR